MPNAAIEEIGELTTHHMVQLPNTNTHTDTQTHRHTHAHTSKHTPWLEEANYNGSQAPCGRE